MAQTPKRKVLSALSRLLKIETKEEAANRKLAETIERQAWDTYEAREKACESIPPDWACRIGTNKAERLLAMTIKALIPLGDIVKNLDFHTGSYFTLSEGWTMGSRHLVFLVVHHRNSAQNMIVKVRMLDGTREGLHTELYGYFCNLLEDKYRKLHPERNSQDWEDLLLEASYPGGLPKGSLAEFIHNGRLIDELQERGSMASILDTYKVETLDGSRWLEDARGQVKQEMLCTVFLREISVDVAECIGPFVTPALGPRLPRFPWSAAKAVDGIDNHLAMSLAQKKGFVHLKKIRKYELPRHLWLSFVGNLARLSKYTLTPEEVQSILAQCLVKSQGTPNPSTVQLSERRANAFKSPRARLEYLSMMKLNKLINGVESTSSYFDLVWKVIRMFRSCLATTGKTNVGNMFFVRAPSMCQNTMHEERMLEVENPLIDDPKSVRDIVTHIKSFDVVTMTEMVNMNKYTGCDLKRIMVHDIQEDDPHIPIVKTLDDWLIKRREPWEKALNLYRGRFPGSFQLAKRMFAHTREDLQILFELMTMLVDLDEQFWDRAMTLLAESRVFAILKETHLEDFKKDDPRELLEKSRGRFDPDHHLELQSCWPDSTIENKYGAIDVDTFECFLSPVV